MDIQELISEHKKLFQSNRSVRAYMAPGRVNLIGEHIDYNGGHVFPCALGVGTYAIVNDRDDKKLCLYSANFPDLGIKEIDINGIVYDVNDGWTNYVKGVFKAFLDHGYEIPHGFDIYLKGNIPGSGLSSSASLEVLVSTILNDTFSLNLDGTTISLLSQEAENRFCGLNCGIMDQFASANGKKDMAMFLDCATLKYEYVPLVLKGYKIIVINSNKPHSLVTSHYNDRRKECELALNDLKKELDINNLCELSPEEFAKHEHLIHDEIAVKRAHFAISEEDRTNKAVTALRNDDIITFGRLINESGDGLRYEYDATCKEIDILVDEARKQPGCIGSRETGGGWGGNTISIVKDESIDDFITCVDQAYREKSGLKADFNILEIGEGGRRIL